MRPAKAIALLTIALSCGCRSAPRPPAHEPVAGTHARTALLFRCPIPGLDAFIEVREYYIPDDKTLTLKLEHDGMFEIMGGVLAVDAPDKHGEHSRGTTWIAARGETVAVRTTSEHAVLRATYIVVK